MTVYLPDIRQALELEMQGFVPPPGCPPLPTAVSYDGQQFEVPDPATPWMRLSVRPASSDLMSFGNGAGYREMTGAFLIDLHEPSVGGGAVSSLERLASALADLYRPGRTLSRNAARVRLAGVRWTLRDEPSWVVMALSIEWSVYARNAA